MNYLRKIIPFICIILGLSFLMPLTDSEAAVKEKKYLTLVQNLDGETWVAYEGLIKVKNDSLMLDAETISEKLYLTYENIGMNKFTVSRGGERTSTYKIGVKKFTHIGNSIVSERNTPCAPFVENKRTYFHYSCLGFLTKVKYFGASKAKEFAKEGYDGIICVSRYHVITGAPELEQVLNTKGKSYFNLPTAPTPTPTPAPVPGSYNSSPSNYLILVNGWYNMNAEINLLDQNFKGLKGLVEIGEDGAIMVNADLLTEYLDNTDLEHDLDFTYHSISNHEFNIICNDVANLYTRNQKEYYFQYKNYFKDTIVQDYKTGDYTAPYISKNNGFDYIDPKSLKDIFNEAGYGYKFYDAEHAPSYAAKGYDGVLVFDLYHSSAKLPKINKVIGSFDFTGMSKLELDKLPSALIQGVKIYGTKEFRNPSEMKSSYSSWGYDFDLKELGSIVLSKLNTETAIFNLLDNSIELSYMGTACQTIMLKKDTKKECYYLYIDSSYGGSLTDTYGQFLDSGESYDDMEQFIKYQGNRDILKALLYKISSEPEVLYDAILDSWAGENEKYSIGRSYVIVGDTQVKFDYDKECYVIKAAK